MVEKWYPGPPPVDYEPQRARLTAWAHEHYIQEFHMQGKVLDAGCGDGFWSSIFHAYGLQVVGIDPNPDSIALGHKRYPFVDLRLLSLEDAFTQQYGGFDIIFVRGMSPFYLDIEHAERLTRMMLQMGERMIMSQFTHQTNEKNVAGHWMWTYQVYADMIERAGGIVRKHLSVSNYLLMEVVNALSQE